MRPPVGAQRDHFPVEDHLRSIEVARELDDLRQTRCHIVLTPREDPNVLADFVDLNARAVELVLECRLFERRQRGLYSLRWLRQHRLYRGERGKPESGQAPGAIAHGGTGDDSGTAREHDGPSYVARRD